MMKLMYNLRGILGGLSQIYKFHLWYYITLLTVKKAKKAFILIQALIKHISKVIYLQFFK